MHLTLPQAIDLALKQNRSLGLARLSVVDSEHKKEIARSAYFPNIKNESSVLHITELAGVEIPAGAFGVHPVTGPIPGQTLFIDQGALTAYTSGTGLAQPLTQMFKIRESNRAATADTNTAKIQVDQAENEVTFKVRQLYYGLLVAQLKQQAATEEIQASQIKDQEAQDAVNNGQALDVAALESRADLLDAKQTELTQRLQIHSLSLSLNDLLGLPLSTQLQLDSDSSASTLVIPSREECVRIAEDQSPAIRSAQQAIEKAKAGLSAAKDAYIPDVTGLARYSYQSGVPFLVHNFGTFGFNLTYDLFDGGRREGEIKESRTLLSEAALNLEKVKDEVSVQVETAYDKVEQLQSMVDVADQALKVRMEGARLSDRQFEQTAALASAREEAHAKAASAKASYLEAVLGLSLAQADLKRTIGEAPR
ncbi:TolC family protein [Alloacidobacterium dinghuense]|uniref:TolC family protein n=1 Tax=Alloacidobacterium dinghuense TaxID=2763107 RepID=A0A7G8BLY6_9BACT|nr:TolC family protein [Alloacidobacterium dinghuense]QNI33556.1 TolC family protein [Alloacidobacterium dinghuense]